MTAAVCFECGGQKVAALAACQHCNAAPRTESELALSLVLCEHLSTKAQMAHFAHEIKNSLRISAPESLLAQARKALRDPQLVAMLGSSGEGQKATQSRDTQGRVSTPPQKSTTRLRTLQQTHLHRNAFSVLGATPRDDRRRIVALAEEKSLEIEQGACQKARSDLTNPRTRLRAEVAWLPGVSPAKAAHLMSHVLKDPMSMRSESGLPPLAHANLLIAAFEAIDAHDDPADIADFVKELADLAEDLSASDVMRDINEDRAVSAFPMVQAEDQVQVELTERKRYFRDSINEALNRLPPPSLVEAMTLAVDGATAGGQEQGPGLIDELVDSYELGIQGFLQKEAQNVQRLIDAAQASAKLGADALKPLIDKLELVARNWDKVAQPTQLSRKARGIDHAPSVELAYSIRSLAIALCNEHNMLAESQRITSLLQELFVELPEVSERVEQDADALEGIFRSQKEAESRRNEWEQEITYRADIGLVFKDSLSISPNGVAWKSRSYPLEAITRVRWGGIQHSINGIPSGTTYTIAFGDNRSEAVVELKRQEIFGTFIEKLWRAVGIRLLTDLLGTLKSGKELGFGDAVVRDDGITLMKHRFLRDEPVRCSWYDVKIWTASGAFYIGSNEDKKTYAALSYIEAANVHILEQAIRMAFKKPGIRRLSELLQGA